MSKEKLLVQHLLEKALKGDDTVSYDCFKQILHTPGLINCVDDKYRPHLKKFLQGKERSVEVKRMANRLYSKVNWSRIHQTETVKNDLKSDMKWLGFIGDELKKNAKPARVDHSIVGIMGKDMLHHESQSSSRPYDIETDREKLSYADNRWIMPSDSTKVSQHKVNNVKSLPMNNNSNLYKKANHIYTSKENSSCEYPKVNGFTEDASFYRHDSFYNRSHNSSRESSSHMQKSSHAVECNNSLSSRDFPFASHAKDAKSGYHKSEIRSPKLTFESQSFSSPERKSISSNHRQSSAVTRPNSLSNPSEFSNDDRPDESKNLMIDNSDNSEVANSDQSARPEPPYSGMELKEGMCSARFMGKVMLECREVRQHGSSLKDGGFSWGWMLGPKYGHSRSLSGSPSASRERTPPVPHRDSKGKRRPEECPSTPPKKGTKVNEQLEVPRKKNFHGNDRLSKSPTFTPCEGNSRNPKQPDCDAKNTKTMDNTTMDFITSKRDRRSIYSGRRTIHEIPSLKITCTEYLKKNIINLRLSRNVPFEVLQPVLELCDAHKLYKVEEQNRHLLRYTNSMWEKKFRQKFKDQVPLERRPWREIYWKAVNDQERKLKSVTANISNGMSKSQPERQMKWMGSDSHDPEKRPKKPKLEESPKPEQHNGRSSTLSKSSESESSSSPQFVQKPVKIAKQPKKTEAPLMSKSKKMLSQVRRR